ncbi:multicomponent Na+:H+ antiporter subunit F [Caldicoprobacter guelmensis]|uniref:monovalent cation/H+ antiporter complex subunit F n=1 Tax=Caldicoprobacter guelmensis TaxID=1170224 RepID=UPI001956B517|nr:monovalent cation/H+ antiporter complex subunit F [Caldicoprobacter guelmensis]MBM7581879.1 multicomponent Na+:H+ antiporter subunit F [Caldicoprobacter guelmensis]
MRFENIVLMVLTILGVASLVRAILGPTVWDRILGVNLLSSKIVMVIVVFAFLVNKSYLLDIAIIYALFGFVGIVMISRFIEKRGEL